LTIAKEQDGPSPIPLGNQAETNCTQDTHSSDDSTPRVDPVNNQDMLLITEVTPNPVDVIIHEEPKESDMDLLSRIHGLYRLLDLISEQGSGGTGMMIHSSMVQGH